MVMAAAVVMEVDLPEVKVEAKVVVEVEAKVVQVVVEVEVNVVEVEAEVAAVEAEVVLEGDMGGVVVIPGPTSRPSVDSQAEIKQRRKHS